MNIDYVATVALVAGHLVGENYVIDPRLKSFNEQRRDNTKKTQTLSGRQIRIVHSENVLYSFKTEILEGAALEAFREYIASTKAGDAHTIQHPDTGEFIVVKMQSHKIERVGNALNKFRYNIQVLSQ